MNIDDESEMHLLGAFLPGGKGSVIVSVLDGRRLEILVRLGREEAACIGMMWPSH